jgi:uncharacterized cupin superfamily protein
VVPEAPLERKDGGLAPSGEGWFVLNVADARWRRDDFGRFTRFEGKGPGKFAQLGVNIGVLEPGQPSCMYHGEADQEDFLVLAGECLVVIGGEERPLKQWDFVHCPPWTEHVFIGAGDGPCALLAMGGRGSEGIIYPAAEVAQRHHAGVQEATPDPKVAYAGVQPDVPTEFRPSWLPGG